MPNVNLVWLGPGTIQAYSISDIVSGKAFLHGYEMIIADLASKCLPSSLPEKKAGLNPSLGLAWASLSSVGLHTVPVIIVRVV